MSISAANTNYIQSSIQSSDLTSSTASSLQTLYGQENSIEFYNSADIVVDEGGEECVIIKHNVDEDILRGIDIEKNIGSFFMKQLQYKIDKDNVNVIFDG